MSNLNILRNNSSHKENIQKSSKSLNLIYSRTTHVQFILTATQKCTPELQSQYTKFNDFFRKLIFFISSTSNIDQALHCILFYSSYCSIILQLSYNIRSKHSGNLLLIIILHYIGQFIVGHNNAIQILHEQNTLILHLFIQPYSADCIH